MVKMSTMEKVPIMDAGRFGLNGMIVRIVITKK
eukprot:CAMPEP_0185620176 /NCGR_PEP_ID=MMETSP0436-20130131/53166_1 /TAXON_ID=626734 ORGANISM="Favella taraikaensis, Strain Fe Narragansett Bay" /NCGR_SAMPLE_ID=MMETSP0436 /ASSEMBLY_ACC=CAM_ASM_000390 /LENGTH=32 /DNA_ID= /DNA_START= /DNA_END= /DNA_ORIENTATION=